LQNWHSSWVMQNHRFLLVLAHFWKTFKQFCWRTQ
jgi:hypothetical protein